MRTEHSREMYFLQPHVHYCKVDDGVVLLDTRNERYLGLGHLELCALAPIVDGWSSFVPPVQGGDLNAGDAASFAEALVRRGLLTTETIRRAERPSVDVQYDRELEWRRDSTARNVRCSELFRFILACGIAGFSIRAFSLERIINSVTSKRARLGADPDGVDINRVSELVRVFSRLRPFVFSSRGRCLFESVALLEFLRMYGVCPLWVIGVRTRPFGAHSWLVYKGLLLNGKVEQTRCFEPLIVV